MFTGLIDLPWWGYIVVLLAMTHVTIAAVTIFLHRCQAHRALELGAVPSHFFRFWLWLTTGMVTRQWAAIHRKHHAKCETAEDPHSPRTRGLRKVLWEGAELYRAEAANQETLDRYGSGTPDDWLERNVYARSVLGVSLMLIIDVLLFGAIGLSLWAVQMIWIPFWAAGVINGLGHFWGYRNFACADASTNLVPWGILIGGEELHNNHHAYGSSAKLSNKWYEFDIGWFYIRILEILGMARVKKVAPRLVLGTARQTMDMDNLQAVITHRYDVLSRYLKSLSQTASEEFEHLKLDARQGRRVQRLLKRDAGSLEQGQEEKLRAVLDRSERLAKVYAMRADLEAVWARSSATREQLLAQLQAWVHKAEESGIRPLQEFSMRLRQYAV
ncbi:MAG: fatty acid desaturase [Proteobacteria bacterium]|nr:fatty acid desaturase [Pseudomonadota bacterium]HQR03685.1 fatty acid desaturase [Rhodocyclaceae bacterium]